MEGKVPVLEILTGLLSSPAISLHRRVQKVLYLHTPDAATHRHGSVTLPTGISQKDKYLINK